MQNAHLRLGLLEYPIRRRTASCWLQSTRWIRMTLANGAIIRRNSGWSVLSRKGCPHAGGLQPSQVMPGM